MTTGTVDRLVADYLADLARAAARLPPGRRAELLDQIATHIDAARAAGDVDDEAGVRTLLDRLGEPEEIVAAALDDGDPVRYDVQLRRPIAVWEIVAVAMLTLGSFVLPILGWLIGAVMAWSSRRWRLWEKLLITLIVPGGPGIAVVALLLIPAQVCTTTYVDTLAGSPAYSKTMCSGFAFAPVVGVPLLILVLLGPFIVGGVLLHRAVTRAAAEPPIPANSRWGGREIAAVLLLGPGAILLPVLAPVAGAIVAWTSPRWGLVSKVFASVSSIAPFVLLALFYAFPSQFNIANFAYTGVLLIALVVIAPIVAAIVFALTLRDRD